MNIGLDFDDTFTRDTQVWLEVIKLFRSRGHKVYVVTMRYDNYEADLVRSMLGEHVDGMYFTGRQLKEKFMLDRNIHIHVWIDDNPRAIVDSGILFR